MRKIDNFFLTIYILYKPIHERPTATSSYCMLMDPICVRSKVGIMFDVVLLSLLFTVMYRYMFILYV